MANNEWQNWAALDERPPTSSQPPWQGGPVDFNHPVHQVPLAALHADPKRFQYKENVNAEGVTQELKSVKKWDQEAAGVLSVWQDLEDQKTYVINGHHRYELANPMEVENLNVMYIQAKDAREARSTGALLNIREGRGTPQDAATFMRETGMTAEQMQERHGVSLTGPVARDASLLSKLSNDLFLKLKQDRLSLDHALAIGSYLPGEANAEKQSYLAERLSRRRDNPPSRSEVAAMARQLHATEKREADPNGQASLFGDDDAPLIEERAALSTFFSEQLKREIRDFGGLTEAKEARVKKAGNAFSVEQNAAIATQAKDQLSKFDQFENLKGPISDALNIFAQQYAEAEGRQEQDAVKRRAAEGIQLAIRDEGE